MNNIIINLVYLPKFGHVDNWVNMGQHKFSQIRENYSFYNNLLSERKSIFKEVIEINKTGKNISSLVTEEDVVHPTITDDKMVLIVDVRVNNHDYFQFKLRYKSFLPAPFFRFDSDGETHRNKIEGVELRDQAITTPHFHKFNENGIEIAYKTDKLLDPRESKALEDINLCIVHFFHESNTRLKDDEFPEIKIMSNTLGFKMTKEDPNQNIDFL
jgi:hypothetical protein